MCCAGAQMEMGIGSLLDAFVQFLVAIQRGRGGDLLIERLDSYAGAVVISFGQDDRHYGSAVRRALDLNPEEQRLVVIVGPKTIKAANEAAFLIKDFGLQKIFKISAHHTGKRRVRAQRFFTSSIPHFGHLPGASLTTSGCMGQVYCTADVVVVADSDLLQPEAPRRAKAVTSDMKIVLFMFILLLSCGGPFHQAYSLIYAC